MVESDVAVSLAMMDAADRATAHELFMALTPEQLEAHYETLFLFGHTVVSQWAAAAALMGDGDTGCRDRFLAETLGRQAEENWWRAKLAVWQQAVVGAHWWETLLQIEKAHARGQAK